MLTLYEQDFLHKKLINFSQIRKERLLRVTKLPLV